MMVALWALILDLGKTLVLLYPMQSCSSGHQQCLGLCDLSMVAVLYSFPLPLLVLFPTDPKAWWCTISFEKVIEQKSISLLEEALDERLWKVFPTPLFKSTR